MSARIKYNGNIIASPGAGRTATLKCEGMKMDSDVVVEVAEQSGGVDTVLAPLAVTKNGTYYPTYESATVTWDENTEYDGTIEVDGVTLRYKKAANLTVPEDVAQLNDPNYYFTVTMSDGTTQRVPLADIGVAEVNGTYMLGDGGIVIVWVKDATIINAGYGASLEDNAVYITDFLWVAGGDNYAGASLTLTAPGQKIDGFSSVTVDVEQGAVVGKWKFDTYEEYGSTIVDIPLDSQYNGEYAVNFTCAFNGETRNCVRFRYYHDDSRGGIQVAFFDVDGNMLPLVSAGGDTPYLDDNMSTTIDFGANPQAVAKEFVYCLEAIATRQSANPVLQEKTVTENGEVLPDAGYDGLSKVTVVVESSGGGAAINGEIKEVTAREAVKAGDFVELVNNGAGYTIVEATEISKTAVAMANQNKMVVTYLQDSTKIFLYAVSFENGEWKKGATISHTLGTSTTPSADTPCIVMLSDNTGVVTFGQGNTSHSAYAMAFRVNDDLSITLGARLTVGSDSADSNVTYDLCKLDSNRAVAYGVYATTSAEEEKGMFIVLTVGENLAVSAGAKTTISTDIGGSCYISPIDESRILVLYDYANSGTQVCKVMVAVVSGTTISLGSRYDVSDLSVVRSCTALSESVFVVAGSKKTFVLNWDGTSFQTIGEISGDTYHVGAVSSTRFLACTSSTAKLMDCESTLEEVSKTALSSAAKGQLLAVTGNSFFNSYFPAITPVYIEGDTIFVGVRSEKAVQPCKGSFNVYGVALDSGNVGDTVRVCVPIC